MWRLISEYSQGTNLGKQTVSADSVRCVRFARTVGQRQGSLLCKSNRELGSIFQLVFQHRTGPKRPFIFHHVKYFLIFQVLPSIKNRTEHWIRFGGQAIRRRTISVSHEDRSKLATNLVRHLRIKNRMQRRGIGSCREEDVWSITHLLDRERAGEDINRCIKGRISYSNKFKIPRKR